MKTATKKAFTRKQIDAVRPVNGKVIQPAPRPVVVEMTRDKECKNFDRFSNPSVPADSPVPPFTNVYLRRTALAATRIRATIEVLD